LGFRNEETEREKRKEETREKRTEHTRRTKQKRRGLADKKQ
jgi:hypothetical protein